MCLYKILCNFFFTNIIKTLQNCFRDVRKGSMLGSHRHKSPWFNLVQSNPPKTCPCGVFFQSLCLDRSSLLLLLLKCYICHLLKHPDFPVSQLLEKTSQSKSLNHWHYLSVCHRYLRGLSGCLKFVFYYFWLLAPVKNLQ